MESQPLNPEFRNNPENFHPCIVPCVLSGFGFVRFDSLHPDQQFPSYVRMGFP